MQLSWGTKIAFLYSGFVGMILTLVGATFMRKNELVTDDYYQQETVFQHRLDAARAATALTEPLRITSNASAITLVFPQRFSGMAVSGTVRFYAPARATADREFPLEGLSDLRWTLERTQLAPVAYEVQVSWQAGGTDYYQALPLQIQ